MARSRRAAVARITDADIQSGGRWVGLPVPSPTRARATLNLQALAQLLGPHGPIVRDLDVVSVETRALPKAEPPASPHHD